jgi:Flp pilus assembly protein TadD
LAGAHLDLGKALEQAGQMMAAEQEYRDALRLRPKHADAEIALGKLLAKRAHAPAGFDEAVEHFRRALRIDPDNAAGQYALAGALQHQGHKDEAAVAFRQTNMLADRIQEQIQCTHLSNDGLDAAARGDRESAIRKLKEAVALRPDIALPHYNLGLVLADKGDLLTAEEQVIEAISLAPFDPRFYIALGQMWKHSGDSQRAYDALERAALLDPGNSTAAAELRNLKSSGAMTAASSKNGQDPYRYGAPTDTPAAHFAFATVLARRGDWIGAAGEWLRVLALQPDNLDARNNLGVCYAHTGQDDKAELEFRKALEVSSDSAGAHFGLAVLALQRGDNRAAIRELREVTRIQPHYPQADKLLSDALKQVN